MKNVSLTASLVPLPLQMFGNWTFGTLVFTVLVFTVTFKVSILRHRHTEATRADFKVSALTEAPEQGWIKPQWNH